MQAGIKLIIFDLDGVLVNTKQIHYHALNTALKNVGEEYIIDYQEHLSIYDGHKTKYKLQLLSEKKKLPVSVHLQVYNDKQKETIKHLTSISVDNQLIELFQKLKTQGYLIACCSNSIRSTVITVLAKLGIIEYFNIILSSEDVKNTKPHPEIYWKAMSMLSVTPAETLIVEDSPVGIRGALASGGDVCRVKDREDLTLEKIKKKIHINKSMNTKWQDDKLNVLIPMAGAGDRFKQAGYIAPKPLINIIKRPMIQVVVENLNYESKHTFIVQKAHRQEYNLNSLLNLISQDCNIIEVDGLTEGAACTTLLAKDIINNDSPLIIANSDQFVEWDTSEFMYKMQEQDTDAGVVCFNATHPKWSFVRLDNNGTVLEVAEKNPISNIATVGIYYWKRGSDYVKYAEQMIQQNIRHNNEFYVCPVFNEAIKDGKTVKAYMIEKMWGLGTPEDLEFYLNNYKV